MEASVLYIRIRSTALVVTIFNLVCFVLSRRETLTIRKHSETLNSRPRRANVKPISFNDVSPKPRIRYCVINVYNWHGRKCLCVLCVSVRNLGADTDGAKDSPNSRPRRANVKPITFIDVSPKPRQRYHECV